MKHVRKVSEFTVSRACQVERHRSSKLGAIFAALHTIRAWFSLAKDGGCGFYAKRTRNEVVDPSLAREDSARNGNIHARKRCNFASAIFNPRFS
jgi:hypothetical protein